MASLSPQPVLGGLHQDTPFACFQNPNITLKEISMQGIVKLQGPGKDSAFCDALSSLLLPLPEVGETTANEELRCYSTGPNEWIFVTPANQENAVMKKLTPVSERWTCLITLVSDSCCVISISGDCVVELLSKACALDLHHRTFSVNQTTVTRFARVAAQLTKVGEKRFELIVDRSQARYIWNWLIDAAGEF